MKIIPRKRKLKAPAVERIEKVKANWNKIVFWGVFSLFISALIYIFLFSGRLAVANLVIRGLNNIDEEELKEDVQREYSGNYLGIIPRNNLIFINKKKIALKLKEDFKIIEVAEVQKKFPSSLVVSIIEHEPKMILCSGGVCFSVDKKGVIYSETNLSSPHKGEEDIPILKDQSLIGYRVGENAFSQEYVDFIASLEEKVKSSLDIDLEHELETPNVISDDIRAKASQGFVILLNRLVGMDKSLDELRVIIGPKIEHERLGDLEYIDLRIDNKIYYKFKGDNGEKGSEEMKSEDIQGAVQGDVDKKTEVKKKKKKN